MRLAVVIYRPILYLIILTITQYGWAFPAKFASSPNNGRDFVLSAIGSAQSHLLINVYEFQNQEVVDAVIDRINAGVNVELLIEAQPTTGHIPKDGQEAIKQVLDSMEAVGNPRNHLYLMKNPVRKERRFVFDHAKYMVIDERRAAISSDNFSNNSMVQPGQRGNRGWMILLEDPKTADQLQKLFKSDSDPSYGDIEELTRSRRLRDGSVPGWRPVGNPPRQTRPLPEGNVQTVSLITSPNSLAGLMNAIRISQRELEIEELDLPSTWRKPRPTFWANARESEQSPIVSELIAAARRGVHVRVLLNNPRAFGGHGKQKNDYTLELLQKIARREGISIEARLMNLDHELIKYVHNKGMVIDDDYVLVSSINGTWNSVMKNREVGALVQSSDAVRYYKTQFDSDWNESLASQSSEDHFRVPYFFFSLDNGSDWSLESFD